jgi:hypothetical protein
MVFSLYMLVDSGLKGTRLLVGMDMMANRVRFPHLPKDCSRSLSSVLACSFGKVVRHSRPSALGETIA